MARRGGRRGRRSRSRQNRSRRTSSRTRSTRRTTTRRSAPSSRRNTRGSGVKNRGRTATKARGTTNTRGTGAKNRGRTGVNASRGRAPTSRRQATRTTRQSRPTRTNTRVAQNQGPSTPVKNYGGNMGIKQNFGAGRVNNVKPKPGFKLSDVYGVPTAFGNALMGIQAANAQPMNTRPKMLANLPKDYKKQEQELSAAADASRYKSLSIDQQRAIQQGKYGETFGLNPVTQRNEINRIRNMIKAQNAARVRQGLDPTFSGQSLKEARDADGDGYADNMGNRIASVYNATLGRLGLPNMPKQTVAGANISMNRPMGQRLPGLVRRRGSSGGASRIQQQAAAQAIQPEIAPTIGQPIEETGAAPTVTGGGAEDLTRIQSQAYNTQLTSSLAGMFGGQGSVGYTPQGDPALSPTLRAGRSRGRRRVRLFGARRRRGGTGDQFSRAGDRIAKLTNINI